MTCVGAAAEAAAAPAPAAAPNAAGAPLLSREAISKTVSLFGPAPPDPAAASRAARSRARDHADELGAGGDRLEIFSHPQPVTTDYVEGGWTYEQLAEKFDGIAEGHLQKVGEVIPELPEELRPSQG